MKKRTQTRPNETVQRVGGASTGALLAIVIQGGAEAAGYNVQHDVAIALGSLIGSITSEIFRTINAYLNRDIETIPAHQVRTTKHFQPEAGDDTPAQHQEKPSEPDTQ